MRIKLDKSTANKIKSIRSSKGRNIVEIAREIGEDLGSFFEGGDWRGLDLRSCDLTGVSFAQANLDDVTVYEDQVTQIRNSDPASFKRVRVVSRPNVYEHEYADASESKAERGGGHVLDDFHGLLRERIRKKHLSLCLKDDNYDFFFVDLGDDGPSWNARRLRDDFERLFAKSHCPKYRTLLNVSRGEPVSISEIQKLDKCVKSYVKHSSAKYVWELEKDGCADGLPRNSVVPCLYILNRTKSRSFGRNRDGTPEVPKKVFDYLMSSIPEGELGVFLSRECGSHDGLSVEEIMRSYSIDGTKNREVRVTSKIAYGVVNFLNSMNPGKQQIELQHLFVWSPARGEGKGRRTKAMSLANGNVLPSLSEAVDYPNF